MGANYSLRCLIYLMMSILLAVVLTISCSTGGGDDPGNGGGGGGGNSGGGGNGEDVSGPMDGVLGNKPVTLQHPALFSAASVWNTPIPDNPAIDPASDTMVAGMVNIANEDGFVVTHHIWTNPVYYADASTPRYDIRLINDWEVADRLLDVPVPDHAEPDPEDDGQLVVIDMDTRIEYDLWQAKKVGSEWQASWGNAISIDSNGIWPRGMSARGAGFALTAGMIWPDELAAGEINHTLVFTYDDNRAGGPIAPATESDARNSGPQTIPEGARLQLDPDLDLDSLGLTAYERTIAECLQEYGMIDCDNGGGIALQAVSWISVAGDPYTGLLPGGTYISLDAIPIDSFRVLEMGPQNPNPDLGIENSGVGVYGGLPE